MRYKYGALPLCLCAFSLWLRISVNYRMLTDLLTIFLFTPLLVLSPIMCRNSNILLSKINLTVN